MELLFEMSRPGLGSSATVSKTVVGDGTTASFVLVGADTLNVQLGFYLVYVKAFVVGETYVVGTGDLHVLPSSPGQGTGISDEDVLTFGGEPLTFGGELLTF
jgi:hypothetical protein